MRSAIERWYAAPRQGPFIAWLISGEAQAWLESAGAPLEAGPYEQAGGAGGGVRRGVSVYTRDPDCNLVEFMTYRD